MILVGSKYFFSRYSDFIPHDVDKLEIIETNEFKDIRYIRGKGRCYFQLKKQQTKEDYINYALESNLGMVVGKFLVPEFCQEIGFTVNDLPRLKPLIDILDEKHKYEEIIYNAYLENNGFFLTQEQRDRAYTRYLQTRDTLN